MTVFLNLAMRQSIVPLKFRTSTNNHNSKSGIQTNAPEDRDDKLIATESIETFISTHWHVASDVYQELRWHTTLFFANEIISSW